MNKTTLELLKPIMITPETELKVGMPVFDTRWGECEVLAFDDRHIQTGCDIYNRNGTSCLQHPIPSLYLQDPFDYLAGMVGATTQNIPYKEGSFEALKKIQGIDKDGPPCDFHALSSTTIIKDQQTLEERVALLEAKLLGNALCQDLHNRITELEKK